MSPTNRRWAWPWVRRKRLTELEKLQGVYKCRRCGHYIPIGWAHARINGEPGCQVVNRNA